VAATTGSERARRGPRGHRAVRNRRRWWRAAALLLALVTILAAAAPASAATSRYRVSTHRLPDGRTVVLRWNPCQVITYRVNVAAVPARSRAAVLREARAAVAAVGRASGLRFRYRGTTTQVPRSTNLTQMSAELVIAVTSRTRTDFPIGGATLGYGGRAWYWWSRTDSGRTSYAAAITRGFVLLDAAGLRRMHAGFGPGATRGNLMLHELGHAVGLDHPGSRSALMYPYLSARSPNGFSAADRAGLRVVGARAGCIAVPGTLPSRDLS
jgi:hypothetical protein